MPRTITNRSLRASLSTPYPELGPFYIRGCLQGAVRRGFDPEKILEAAGIDPSVYSDPQARINGEQLQRLLQTIRRTLNDEFLGLLEIPHKLQMSYMIGMAAVKCKTFGQALVKHVKLINAVRDDIELQLDTSDSESVAISFKASGFTRTVEPYVFSWIGLYNVYKFHCWLVGQRIKLKSVGVSFGRPDGIIDYRALFGCPTEFDQERSYLSFSRHYLDAPVIRNEVEIRQPDLDFGSSNWFSIPGGEQTLSSQVEQMLINHYRKGGGSINLDVLGDIFHCSPRTLSRKLQKEEITFQEIKDKVLFELAQRFLSTTQLSIAEIATRVGFSEPADFTRAFLAWTGRTPSEFRRR
jgi:AraC-like DNA-binding protein